MLRNSKETNVAKVKELVGGNVLERRPDHVRL